MEPEVLNRIGIILNFLAGFLLAPELLGTERLEKMETSLERASDKLADRGNLAKSKVGRFFLDFFFDTHRLSFRIPPSSTPITRKILFWSQLAVFFGAIAFLISWLFYERVENTNFLEPMLGVLLIVVVSIIFLMGFGIPILLIVIWAFTGVIVFLARLLFNKLAGDNKLRSGLVWLGIICFIAGNTLQFVATF